MYAALHEADKNIQYTINHDCLVDHNDHCGVGHWVFVHIVNIYSTGMVMSVFLIITVNVYLIFCDHKLQEH